jgi:hypothetical protein
MAGIIVFNDAANDRMYHKYTDIGVSRPTLSQITMISENRLRHY